MENKELRYKWEARIASYKSSGQTQAKWCEANQISMHQFKYWYKKISGPVFPIDPYRIFHTGIC